MPRLIDDLRSKNGARVAIPNWVLPRNERAWTEYALHAMSVVNDPDMPVLLTDNVANYFYTQSDQEHWSIDRDFPNIAPPFPKFWVEWKMVMTIHSKDEGDTDVSKLLPQGGRVGQMFVALDPSEVKGENIPGNCKWIYWCDMWTDYHQPGITAVGPQGATFICDDDQGRAIGNPWMHSYGGDDVIEILKNMMAWYNPTLLAISFLHCKNVTLVDNVVDAPLAKKWASKHGGQRPVAYKTLIIEPLKAILRKEGRAHEHGLQKALHICRGHFADYTGGRGLFGKYHGKFWIPSVVRGTRGVKAAPREIEVKV